MAYFPTQSDTFDFTHSSSPPETYAASSTGSGVAFASDTIDTGGAASSSSVGYGQLDPAEFGPGYGQQDPAEFGPGYGQQDPSEFGPGYGQQDPAEFGPGYGQLDPNEFASSSSLDSGGFDWA